jgi:MFS family permease
MQSSPPSSAASGPTPPHGHGPTPDHSPARTRDAFKLSSIAAVAASIEYFDFFLYGLASALVFPALFFPESTPLMGLLLSFAAFGVGFVARPLGGIVFGHFGDKYGRKKALVIALLIMGVATMAIGLLPTHAVVGAFAPVLLVALRLVQGIAMGGQMGGVVLLAAESAPERHRGFFGSFSSLGAPGGTLLANLLFLAVTAGLSEEALMSWGWRLPFFASIVLVFLAIYIHLRIEDTDAFRRLQEAKAEEESAAGTGTDDDAEAKAVVKAPLVKVLTRYPKEIVLTVGTYLGLNVTYYVFVTFVLTYGSSEEFLGFDRSVMLTAVLIGAAAQLVGLLFGGWLSDRIGRARTIGLGAITVGLFSFALWPMIETGSTVVISLAMVLGLGIFHSLIYGAQPTYFVEAFDTDVRYSGVSLGIQIASVIGGAFAPLIATALANRFGWISLAIYMAASCAVTLISVILLGETRKKTAVR